MKTGLVLSGPDVVRGPLALLSGTFEEKIQKAARLGFDGVEIMVRDPGKLDWQAVARTLACAGLETPQLVTGELFGEEGLMIVTADLELHQRAVNRLKSVIDMAAFLGAMVNIGRVRGRLDQLGEVRNPWELAVERLSPVIDYAACKEVKLTLEPLNRYETDFILTVEDGLQMIYDLKADNVGLMLDLFHMNIEEASIEGALRLAGEQFWHLHIADSQRHYPGSGHMNYDPIFETLSIMNYSHYISAEILPLPDPDTAAREVMAFLSTRLKGDLTVEE